ncbi:MAG: hypothetical protein PHS24_01870 [Bacilli bacterium]|nr:hypothetical protein [Bacilli bacterium]
MLKLEDLLNEVLKEASNGNIIIDGDPFPIGFNSKIYEENKVISYKKDDNFPVLIIKNKKLFFIKLANYLSIAMDKVKKFPNFSKDKARSKLKTLITYLFVNATSEDFVNPLELIDRNISFLKDDTFDYLNQGINIPLQNCFDESFISIKNTDQSVFMETNHKINISLFKQINDEYFKYILPDISYGIRINANNEKVCYIYSIINPKTKLKEEKTRYAKKVARELYKLNYGVFEAESEEYKNYKMGKGDIGYYPENISDISPSALLSLSIFISLLETEDIKNIKVVSFLPVRYLSREIIAQRQINQAQARTLHERNNELQRNITDKFLRTFERATFHINGIKINSYPFLNTEFMEISLNEINHDIKNIILNDVYNSVLNKLQYSTLKNHHTSL